MIKSPGIPKCVGLGPGIGCGTCPFSTGGGSSGERGVVARLLERDLFYAICVFRVVLQESTKIMQPISRTLNVCIYT